jgi:hypothetical protein
VEQGQTPTDFIALIIIIIIIIIIISFVTGFLSSLVLLPLSQW